MKSSKNRFKWILGVGLLATQFAQADFCKEGKACFNYDCSSKEATSSDQCEANLSNFFSAASGICGINIHDINCSAENAKMAWYFQISTADMDLGIRDKYRHVQSDGTQTDCMKAALKVVQELKQQAQNAGKPKIIYQPSCQQDIVPGTEHYECSVPSENCIIPSPNGDIDNKNFYGSKYHCPADTDLMILTKTGTLIKFGVDNDGKELPGIPAHGTEATAFCKQRSTGNSGQTAPTGSTVNPAN